jgi:acyl dehydratase
MRGAASIDRAQADTYGHTREDAMPGLYFDELVVGQVFKHPISRTITEADNVFFSALTHNPALLHLDENYCREHTEFGQRIVNSAFTLGLMVGISVGDTTLGTAVANLGWDEVRFPKPLFHGDTVRVETEVIELRESRSRPNAGIVTFMHRAYNQRGDLVAHCKRSGLQLKRPAA